jgi:hypothetical protein
LQSADLGSSFLQSSNLNRLYHVIDHLYYINNMDDSLNGKQSRLARYKKHLAQDVDKSWADLVLIVACFISGLVDSAVFNVWSCFVSMQTGM